MSALFIFHVKYPGNGRGTFCWALPEHWSVRDALWDFEVSYAHIYKQKLGPYVEVYCEKKEGLQVVYVQGGQKELEG